jgi:hypothetical protein
MATYVSDSFTDAAGTDLASHTGEVGATWTRHGIGVASAMLVTDVNRVRVATVTALYYASGVPASADYEVSADFTCLSTGTVTGHISGRTSTSVDTRYMVRHGGTAWQLFSVGAGSYTSIGSFTQSLSVGVTYAVKLSLVGTAVKVFIDGVQQISVTNSVATAAGRGGLGATSSSNSTTNSTGVHIDNFLVADATSAAVGQAWWLAPRQARNRALLRM